MQNRLLTAAATLALLALLCSPLAAQLQTSGARAVSAITNGAGTVIAAVLDLTNNDAVAVAIVDGAGTHITSFGGGTQYAEDTPGADGDVMTLAGARRQDTPTTDTSLDGDRTHLKSNAVGALWVQLNGGTVAATQSGVWNATQTGTWNVGLSTGANTIGKVAHLTTCGTTAFDQAWAAVPTSATAVTGTTTCAVVVVATNTNVTAQTLTVTDGQGSPITAVDTFSIPGKSTVRFELGKMTTGFKWTAGGSGITGSAAGVQ